MSEKPVIDERAKQEESKIEVMVPVNLRQGVYSNLASLNVSENEIIIDFLVVTPNDVPKGTLVSRVIMSKEHGEELQKVLANLLKNVSK